MPETPWSENTTILLWRITGMIERLFTETELQPNPSFRCNYCPYHGNACTPPPPGSLPLTPRTDDSAALP